MALLQKIAFFMLFSLSVSAMGQNLTSKEKQEILKAFSSYISENYVLQDSVPLILTELKKSKESAEFAKDYTKDSFASYLTVLLRSITSDAHFAVLHNPSLFKTAQLLQSGDGDVNMQNVAIGNRSLSNVRKNFFFRKLEVLEGNVGYLKLEQMPALEEAKSTLDAAMQFLSHTDGMIIDLRGNRGGVGGFIPYLMSYFFEEENKLLYRREYLAWDSVSYHRTHEELPVNRYLSKSIFILIDRFTGSAATNMAYCMSSFERATLFGENTGAGYRGAHSASIYPLGQDLVGLIPIGRVVNAKTQTNWRMQGVDPDFPCNPEDALEIALKEILSRLEKESRDEEVKKELREALDKLEASAQKASNEKPTEDLSEYSGTYGETVISWENGKLFTKRPTVPMKLELKRKQGDVFEIVLPAGARGNVPDLRFDRENGKIVSVTTIRNGKEERVERRK